MENWWPLATKNQKHNFGADLLPATDGERKSTQSREILYSPGAPLRENDIIGVSTYRIRLHKFHPPGFHMDSSSLAKHGIQSSAALRLVESRLKDLAGKNGQNGREVKAAICQSALAQLELVRQQIEPLERQRKDALIFGDRKRSKELDGEIRDKFDRALFGAYTDLLLEPDEIRALGIHSSWTKMGELSSATDERTTKKRVNHEQHHSSSGSATEYGEEQQQESQRDSSSSADELDLGRRRKRQKEVGRKYRRWRRKKIKENENLLDLTELDDLMAGGSRKTAEDGGLRSKKEGRNGKQEQEKGRHKAEQEQTTNEEDEDEGENDGQEKEEDIMIGDQREGGERNEETVGSQKGGQLQVQMPKPNGGLFKEVKVENSRGPRAALPRIVSSAPPALTTTKAGIGDKSQSCTGKLAPPKRSWSALADRAVDFKERQKAMTPAVKSGLQAAWQRIKPKEDGEGKEEEENEKEEEEEEESRRRKKVNFLVGEMLGKDSERMGIGEKEEGIAGGSPDEDELAKVEWHQGRQNGVGGRGDRRKRVPAAAIEWKKGNGRWKGEGKGREGRPLFEGEENGNHGQGRLFTSGRVKSSVNTCPYCEQSDPLLQNAAFMRGHLARLCPFICRCDFCDKLVEVHELNEHQLRRCPFAGDTLAECQLCGMARYPDEPEGHPKCKFYFPPRGGAWCPLCCALVKNADSKREWLRHLTEQCYNNPRTRSWNGQGQQQQLDEVEEREGRGRLLAQLDQRLADDLPPVVPFNHHRRRAATVATRGQSSFLPSIESTATTAQIGAGSDGSPAAGLLSRVAVQQLKAAVRRLNHERRVRAIQRNIQIGRRGRVDSSSSESD